MTRVDEIVAAIKFHPEPMFLFGLASLARYEPEGLMRDLIAADR